MKSFEDPLAVSLMNLLALSPQEPKDICMYAGFCPKMKFSPMLKLQPAKTVPMAKTVAAAKLFPATKVESANKKSAVVCCISRLLTDPLMFEHKSEPDFFFGLQKMVAVRQSNLCSVCEFVMKELEEKLQDPSTEVRPHHDQTRHCRRITRKKRSPLMLSLATSVCVF